MKEKQSKTMLYFTGSMFILFMAVVALVLMFMHANRERIAKQNMQYLEDAADQTVRRMDELFDYAEMSIRMVSHLYELQLTEPAFDYNLLHDMSEPTPFDHIRFISMDGKSYSEDGTTVDCHDREYYLEGIAGHTGMEYINASRFTNGSIFVFYAPLYYQEEMIGVVDGIIDADRFARQLDTNLFDESSNPCICTPEGEIVAAAWRYDGADSEHMQKEMFSYDSLSGDTKADVKKAMEAGESISFRYGGRSGDGIAYLAPLAGGKLILVQTFPASVSKALTARANRDAIRLEIAMIVLFLVYIVITAVYYIRRNRRLSGEKKDLSQIVDSVKRMYKQFVIFDLEADTYEYLEAGEMAEHGIPALGLLSDWTEEIGRRHEINPECWDFIVDMTVPSLRRILTQENWFTHREYLTLDGHWERMSLIKLDMDQERTDRILGAVEDITDVKKRSEENRKAMEEAFHAAEAANRAKSEFLSRMSHDIRTPMNAIVGLTAIMGAHLDEKDRIMDCLTKITSSSKHLLGLINEVLDMSKIESGKLALSEMEFTLPALVDDLLHIVQPMINAKHQNFAVNIRDIAHENVIGDNIRLQQVFVNILSNAVKYTDEGGHISVTVSERPGAHPLIAKYDWVIEDDGIGMSPEFLERIFTPFERAQDERVSAIQGTGLGMSIAQSIVRLMGGSISVESEEGKGSKFTVSISLRLQEADEVGEDRLIGLPVLVADDEQTACEATCLLLSELGMRGEWVLTGQEAVQSVKEHHDREEDFFAVILDWKMPGMDGVETARAIRKEVGSDVPIIILSAYDWSDIENEARAAGVNVFIGKPLFRSRLRGVCLSLVSDHSQGSIDALGSVRERDYSGKRALLVEDNELNQEIAQEILEMTGLAVEIAENGKVAVERFESVPLHYYDIVFMDVQMPVMNGLDATRAIRALPREDAKTTPIVAMTANSFSEDVQACMEAGMVQHIGKPLDIGRLMAMLDKWL